MSKNDFDEGYSEGYEDGEIKGSKQTLKDVLKIIDDWSKIKCIDEYEKCHECINELKEQISKEIK